MSSRRYIKRVWRVPKDRGALEYFGTVVLKALVKHGWPAKLDLDPETNGFLIRHIDGGDILPPDMEEAFGIAVRIAARTHRVEVSTYSNWCGLDHEYRVTNGGHIIEK